MEWIQIPLNTVQWRTHGAFGGSMNFGKFLDPRGDLP